MYKLHNGVITIPNAHSPNQEAIADTLKIFPSPLVNQPPSIDVVLSTGGSDPIPIEDVAYLVQLYAYHELSRVENQTKFGRSEMSRKCTGPNSWISLGTKRISEMRLPCSRREASRLTKL